MQTWAGSSNEQPFTMERILAVVIFLTALKLGVGLSESREDVFVGYTEKGRSNDKIGGAGRIVIDTEEGKIPILLLRKNAPHTTDLVFKLAARRDACPTCKFYRNEAKPKPGDLGPPYGLLQGSLAEISGLPPREGNLVARRGHVCMVPGTKEFFIALLDHSEWGTAHTVWGEVEDMRSVDAIVASPYHERTHPDYGTKMRMLDREVAFRISMADPVPA